MKLDNDIKNALGKINIPQSINTDFEAINQKYKQSYMAGGVIDTFAGMEADGIIYDKDMIKREFIKKKLIYIPFIIIAFMATIIFGIFTYKNMYIRLNGQVVTAKYVEKSRLCKRTVDGEVKTDGYVYVMKYSGEDTVGREMSISLTFNPDVRVSGRFVTDKNTIINTKDFFVDLINNSETIELALVVYPENIKFYQDFNNNNKINLYYVPSNGEDYLDVRILEKIWLLIIADVLTVIVDIFWGWIIYRSIKEEKRINKSFEQNRGE